MVNHVLFFSFLPISTKLETNFYINELLDQGYKVTYLDISEIFTVEVNYNCLEERSYATRIKSVKEFEQRIADAQGLNTLIIPILTFNYQVLPFFRIISKYNIKLGFFARGMFPMPSFKTHLLQKLLSNLFNYKKILLFIQNRIALFYKFSGLVKKYDVVFTAGKYGEATIGIGGGLDMKKAVNIKINYFDYDKFIQLKKSNEKEVEEPYCVFLDQYLPYHPDFELLGISKINAAKYFASINAFFDAIEEKYNVRVVIAAHPSASYTDNPYQGREIIKGKTAELVKHAELVLGHVSTSVSYCVLYNKPVIIFYNEEVLKWNGLQSHRFMSEAIGGCLIDADAPSCLHQMEGVCMDAQKYALYKYNFLTSVESENYESVDIFINHLKLI